MANTYFRFKQFTVHQDRAAMKVGTDGILLGAWAQLPPKATYVLDVGTGTGLIALMAGQRCGATVIGIDSDVEAYRQAGGNFSESPWADRVESIHSRLQEFDHPSAFDAILCNPPFYQNAYGMSSTGRSKARHAVDLSYHDLALDASRLLAVGGRFSTILPSQYSDEFITTAKGNGLHLSRLCCVYPKPGTACKRHLLEFTAVEAVPALSDLVVETHVRHTYTPSFRTLTQDYYLDH